MIEKVSCYEMFARRFISPASPADYKKLIKVTEINTPAALLRYLEVDAKTFYDSIREYLQQGKSVRGYELIDCILVNPEVFSKAVKRLYQERYSR